MECQKFTNDTFTIVFLVTLKTSFQILYQPTGKPTALIMFYSDLYKTGKNPLTIKTLLVLFS